MNLVKKLIEIRKQVPYLQKESNNKAQGFKYNSSSQVLGAIRKLVDDGGLLLVPAVKSATFHSKDSIGGGMHLTEIEESYTWIDSEDGETLKVDWYSQGCDQHEKGVGKAYTYGEKFFLLKFFQIATDQDDPDAFERKMGNGDDKPARRAAKPAPKDGELTKGQIMTILRKELQQRGKGMMTNRFYEHLKTKIDGPITQQTLDAIAPFIDGFLKEAK